MVCLHLLQNTKIQNICPTKKFLQISKFFYQSKGASKISWKCTVNKLAELPVKMKLHIANLFFLQVYYTYQFMAFSFHDIILICKLIKTHKRLLVPMLFHHKLLKFTSFCIYKNYEKQLWYQIEIQIKMQKLKKHRISLFKTQRASPIQFLVQQTQRA